MFDMKKRFSKSGFTLIEVLVVIAIIGILSAILYANFGNARVDARNKTLKSEIKEVQLALEVYKSQNGYYPKAAGTDHASNYNNELKTALVPEFIAEMPVNADSSNSNCSLKYVTDVNGTYFKLTAARCHGGAANAADGVQQNDEFARCPSSCSASPTKCGTDDFDATYKASSAFYESYAVYSYGGQCQ